MQPTKRSPHQGPDLPPHLQIVLDTLNDQKRATNQSLDALLQVLADRNQTILRLQHEIAVLDHELEDVKAYLRPRLGTPGPPDETEITLTA